MTFHVGQKAVCVRDGWNIYPDHLLGTTHVLPVAGVEYVVRSITDDELTGGQAIRLLWLSLPPNTKGDEPAFGVVGTDGIVNFRPVVERKTDISIFTELLNSPTKEIVGA
jgi:hypothetical protein